ncbi:hypothetical protein MMC17_001681 [Xylographa soralifera]|nr:hypothetical protein [Xylographa soralifera]
MRLRKEEEAEILITCFFEELGVSEYGEVVPKHSAILPQYASYGIRANHMNMTKFSSSDDAGYDAILGELQRWIKPIRQLVRTSALTTSLPLRLKPDVRSWALIPSDNLLLVTKSVAGERKNDAAHYLVEDMGFDLINDLPKLMADMQLSQTVDQQITIYLQMQQLIRHIVESVQASRSAMEPDGPKTSPLVLRSRRGLTKGVIKAIDKISVMLETAPEKIMHIMWACYSQLPELLRRIAVHLRAIEFVCSKVHHTMAGDYIRFEDYSGHVRWLDRTYIQYYPVFTAFIHKEYSTRPGGYKIINNEFRIVGLKDPELEVSESTWEKLSTTGARLLMAATTQTSKYKHCPSCQRRCSNDNRFAYLHIALKAATFRD